MLEKTLESPLNCKEIKLVNPKGNQPWIWNGRTAAEAPVIFHLIWRVDSLEKTLMLARIEGKRRRKQRIRWLGSITNSMDMNLSNLQEILKDRKAWHAAVHGVSKSQTWLSNWTTELVSIELMNTLLTYTYRAFLISIKQYQVSYLSICFTEAFSINFERNIVVTWQFHSCLYFSCTSRPWLYCRFDSRSQPLSKYHNKASHTNILAS